MTAHSNESRVQERGCSALFSLTFNKSVAARIQFEGGLAVLEQNPSNFNAKIALLRIRGLAVLQWIRALINLG
jgi:hypothetical protein